MWGMAKNIPVDIERHPTDPNRQKNGRMIEPLPGKFTITQANASTLAKKRWAKYRQSAAAAIAKEAASIDPSVVTSADAWGLVAARQYVTLIDSDKPRVDDLQKLGQIMGAMPNAHDLRQEEGSGAVSGAVAGASAALLLIAELKRRGVTSQIIDVEANGSDN